MFDLARIVESGLVAQIDFHRSLGSTNDRAIELGARDEADLPLLVLTERQMAGRGRGSNRWLTEEGALTFSLVLEAPVDRLPTSKWPHVALASGVAIADALAGTVPRAALQLKWPNDVYLNERKTAGILSESVPGWRDRLVVGIGINVNNRMRDSTQTGLRGIATSLIDHDGIARDLTTVLLDVLDELDRRWKELLECGFGMGAVAYRERCLLTGKSITVKQGDGDSIVGLCRGIDDDGRLVIRTPDVEKSLISGTVIDWEK